TVPKKVTAISKMRLFNGVSSDGTDRYAERQIVDNFWLCTDKLGRDMWTRTWKGTKISSIIDFVAAVVALLIWFIYGCISGDIGVMTNNILQLIIEVLMVIPQLVIIILLIMILKPGLLSIIIAIAMTGWIGQSRIVRGQILKIKTEEYVLAARTLGAKPRRI